MIIRAARSTYIVVLLIWAAPTFLVTAALVRNSSLPSVWAMAALTAAIGMILYFWIYLFRIEVDAYKLSYTTLFGGRRTLRLSDLGSVRFMVGYRRYCDRFLPPVRLEICLRKGVDGPCMVINAKIFDHKALNELMRRLDLHAHEK